MNILFIDDQPIRARKLNHNVFVAHGFDQIAYYLRLQKQVKFDAIMLDHDMPLMTGMAVLHEFSLFIASMDVKVIIHSAAATDAPQRMKDLLDSYSIDAKMICVTEENWENKVDKYLIS